jgi:hypothetical protein
MSAETPDEIATAAAHSLPYRLRQLAAGGSHEHAVELFARARDLEAALQGVRASGVASIKRLVGAWARARKLWCELTGEDLV